VDAYSIELRRAINFYVRREIGFDEFETLFNHLFIEVVPDGSLTEDELAYFGEVNEKLMWTSPDPTALDRTFGWLDAVEFREWLANHSRR
jgi:hypothetical protein